MIVWLASYPRSGNTLLRTVLKQTLGLDSYGDPESWERKLSKPTRTLPTSTSEITGGLRPSMTWEEFYPMATQSPEVFLVKTHQAPIDAQPVIHVVRDGRKAVTSYFHFHRDKHSSTQRTILQIIAGEDLYSDWTSHYDAWRGHSGPRMEVRFEELVDASVELVGRIANFIGHKGQIQPWQNPFETLHEVNPSKFREGRTEWTSPAEWGSGEEWAFCALHAPLMEELGYEAAPKMSASIPAMANASSLMLSALGNRTQGAFSRNALRTEGWVRQMQAALASSVAQASAHSATRNPSLRKRQMAPRPEFNGIRAKDPESPTIYLVDQGYKRAIPDAPTYNGLFRDWKGIVTDLDLSKVPEGPHLSAKNILVRSSCDEKPYLIDGNMKRPIEGDQTLEAFHFDPKKVHVVPEVLIEPFQVGRPLSTLSVKSVAGAPADE